MAAWARRWRLAALLLPLLLLALWWGARTLVPGLVRAEAQAWARDRLGLELALGDVRFDPLRLALDLHDIALPADAPMIAARHVRLDLAFRSLFSDTLRLDSIVVDGLRIDAELAADGRLNLARLVPPDDGTPPPAILVAELRVSGGQFGFRDPGRGPDAEARLIPLDFELADLHTTRDAGGRFRLKGTTAAGESLGWTGTLSLAPLASTGGIAVQGLEARRIGAFLGDLLPAVPDAGVVSLALPYRAARAGDRLELVLSRPRAELRDLALRPRPDMLNAVVRAGSVRVGAGEVRLVQDAGGRLLWSIDLPAAEARHLVVEGTGPARGETVRAGAVRLADVRAGAEQGGVAVGALGIDGLDLAVQRGPGRDIRLRKLLPDREPGAGPALPVAIGQIALADARIAFDERSTPRTARYLLAPLSAVVSGFRSDGASPLTVELTASLDGRPLRIAGTAAADGSSADLAFRLSSLPLAAALPYLPDFPALELMSGTIGVDGRLRYRAGRGGRPGLGFDGAVEVAGFRLRELVRNSDLVRFDRLRMTGIAYDGRGVTVADARLVRPQAQVALLADGRFNYGFLLDEGTSVEEARARLAARQAPAKRLSRAERRAARAQAEADRRARAEARALAASRAEPELPLTIRRLAVENGTLVFSDFVIEPDFRATIEAVNGRLSGVTNRPGRVAEVKLAGQVTDRFSPVVIEGRMNLFDYAAATDMRLQFRNIDLPVFNPYSGTYAGYAIARGKLTAELDYRVENAALAASHRIVIDSLEWGEATESKQKVGLPVRFATAILKDRRGVITLELPVSGTVDDPEFRLMPLIWKALGQFMGKLVTAPFRALGGLFADREDARFVDFAPGSAELPAGAAETLSALGRALAERPALRLDIPASPGIDADADALAARALEAALMAGGRKGEAGMAFADLPLERQYDRIRDLWDRRMPGRPAFGAEEDVDRDARRAARVAQLRAALLPGFRPDAAALRQLGEARAQAVRGILLAGGEVDPERVFLDGNDRFAAAGDRVRMELRLR